MLTVQLLHVQGRGPPPTAPIAVGPHAAAPRPPHGESSGKLLSKHLKYPVLLTREMSLFLLPNCPKTNSERHKKRHSVETDSK